MDLTDFPAPALRDEASYLILRLPMGTWPVSSDVCIIHRAPARNLLFVTLSPTPSTPLSKKLITAAGRPSYAPQDDPVSLARCVSPSASVLPLCGSGGTHRGEGGRGGVSVCPCVCGVLCVCVCVYVCVVLGGECPQVVAPGRTLREEDTAVKKRLRRYKF